MATRNWIPRKDAAAMRGRHESTVSRMLKAGELDNILQRRRGSHTEYCAEAIWRFHLTGSTEGCDDLATIQAFVAEFPLPDDAPGESRLAS